MEGGRLKFGETVSLSFIKEFSQTTEGERLEKLQRLLKFEELEQEAGLDVFAFQNLIPIRKENPFGNRKRNSQCLK
jgi:hypothetical protein